MIELNKINKRYRDGNREIHVLRDLSLTIKNGESVSVMGRSGCGKSTLLHILGGIEKIDSGNYLLDGTAMDKLGSSELAKIRAEKIGLIFQSYFLVKSLDCVSNVELPLGYAGVKAKERRERAITALEYVGMCDCAARNVTKLSGGQQQRVAIARAIVTSPSLILADEPTGNLDPDTAEQTIELLIELAKKNSSTLVVVTHDSKIASYADTRLIMVNGVIQNAELTM